MPEPQREIMEDSKTYPTPSLTTRVYDESPTGSPILWLMVDIWTMKAGREWYERGD
jgi:hypothetical protein